MHILLGLLTAIVTIAVLLKRLADAGIGLGGLNPFLWNRRQTWRDKYTGNPIFNVDDPMAASALLLTAAAKIDGDMSSEQKAFVLDVFQNQFHLSAKDASGLLTSSTYLLGDGQSIKQSLEKVINPSLPHFNESQANSTITLLQRLSELDNPSSELREDFVKEVETLLKEPFEPKQDWS